MEQFRMKEDCNHIWVEDERFNNGSVIMLFGDIDDIHRESRFICKLCGAVDYKIRK